MWQCYDDAIIIDGDSDGNADGGHTDYIYNIGATSSNTASKTESQTYSDCAITYACELWDEDTNVWVAASDPPIKTCSSAGLVWELEDTDSGYTAY